jgi:hypothetical protein
MKLPKQLFIKILIFILVPLSLAGAAISWDLQRLDKDFYQLYSLLRTARWDAFYKDTTIVVRFNSSTVTVTNEKDLNNMTTTIPMIAKVAYDTTLGNDMIVYTLHGTAYNKRVHGGEIMLKSLLGFRRYIHVNCNGWMTEERYPEDVKSRSGIALQTKSAGACVFELLTHSG